MRHRIIGIAGSVRRPSKTRSLVETIGTSVTRAMDVDLTVYDLVDAGSGFGAAHSRTHLPASAQRILRDIETADALIVGSPIYKGSYTGLFKHLIDFIEPDALRDVPVVLTAMGGGTRHALMIEHQLRPLFGFFEALTLPTAVYASDPDFVDGQLADVSVLTRAAAAAAQLTTLLDQRPRHSASVTPVRLASVR
ncbi:FMN reductase [Microvirga aerophila]|uniref:FMN reductase n=1 Tax=Microvirga aerophila TaxID=670291 RepID=A0A512C3U9_9HYPH|nr:FMN reductase [Microvirga aerophila]GEO18881.1 FMN reductase [Microvirga aerophila]